MLTVKATQGDYARVAFMRCVRIESFYLFLVKPRVSFSTSEQAICVIESSRYFTPAISMACFCLPVVSVYG